MQFKTISSLRFRPGEFVAQKLYQLLNRKDSKYSNTKVEDFLSYI